MKIIKKLNITNNGKWDISSEEDLYETLYENGINPESVIIDKVLLDEINELIHRKINNASQKQNQR